MAPPPTVRSGAHRSGPGDAADTELVRTVGGWFGPRERPLFGWLSTPAGGITPSGVLILPAIGYQYWSAYRTLRVIAERLASAGHTVLRLDYDGTGDSAGDQWDPGRVEAWRGSVAAAVAELRGLGCLRLVLAGVRLGGTLALLEGSTLAADAVAAWEPVPSGRRFAREVRMLATDVPEDPGRPAGAIAAAGVVYTPQTLAALERLGLGELEAAPAPRALIVAASPDVKLIERLRALGCDAEGTTAGDGRDALEVPAEDAIVPAGVVEALCEWVGAGEPAIATSGSARPPPSRGAGTLRERAELTVGGAIVREEVVTLGPDRLVGVLSEQRTVAPGVTTAVFLNSGSEPHIGSGRTWVEFARELAAAGHRCLRVDFRGWGESPDGGFAPGRPYDAHTEEDTVAIVRALRARGHERIVLVGLCAGAWIALRTELVEPVAGVIALNPQLYWKPGDPVEALLSDTRVRRAPERSREERGGRCGIWTALDIAGQRPWAGRWLDEIVASRVPTVMVFADGDDGIEYLRNRLARRLDRAVRSGILRVVEVPGIDHSMHRVWLRPRMLETIRAQLEALGAR